MCRFKYIWRCSSGKQKSPSLFCILVLTTQTHNKPYATPYQRPSVSERKYIFWKNSHQNNVKPFFSRSFSLLPFRVYDIESAILDTPPANYVAAVTYDHLSLAISITISTITLVPQDKTYTIHVHLKKKAEETTVLSIQPLNPKLPLEVVSFFDFSFVLLFGIVLLTLLYTAPHMLDKTDLTWPD